MPLCSYTIIISNQDNDCIAIILYTFIRTIKSFNQPPCTSYNAGIINKKIKLLSNDMIKQQIIIWFISGTLQMFNFSLSGIASKSLSNFTIFHFLFANETLLGGRGQRIFIIFRLVSGVVSFNEEPVDKGSYGPSHHGGYNRHPPPVTNTAL